MKNSKLYWKSSEGNIKITDMKNGHLINAIKMINRLSYKANDFEYPECYDIMIEELEKREIDPDVTIIDFELDRMFPGLDDV